MATPPSHEPFLDPALRRRLGAPAVILGGARGELRVWGPSARRVLVTEGWGHAAAELAGPFLAELDAAVARGAVQIWNDWASIRSYDTLVRTSITGWTRDHPAVGGGVHVLVDSKVVAMGVGLANMALGHSLHVTVDRAGFERDLLARL
jgi:hypothetical protein